MVETFPKNQKSLKKSIWLSRTVLLKEHCAEVSGDFSLFFLNFKILYFFSFSKLSAQIFRGYLSGSNSSIFGSFYVPAHLRRVAYPPPVIRSGQITPRRGPTLLRYEFQSEVGPPKVEFFKNTRYF